MAETISDAELRATSDLFKARLAEINDLEQRKREVVPSDAEFSSLAEEVERAVELLLQAARQQTELSRGAVAQRMATPIEEIPEDISAAALLQKWRVAERRLLTLGAGSDETHDLQLTIDAYRRAYQELFERKSRSA